MVKYIIELKKKYEAQINKLETKVEVIDELLGLIPQEPTCEYEHTCECGHTCTCEQDSTDEEFISEELAEKNAVDEFNKESNNIVIQSI